MFTKLFYSILGSAFCLVCISSKSVTAYDINPDENSGDLIGTIQFKGEVPENTHFKVSRNSEFCGLAVADESLIVNHANKGIKNVVVSFEKVSFGKKHEMATITIDNSKCRFVPRIQAAMIGDFYELKNSDSIIHNTLFHRENDENVIISVALPPSINPIKRPLIKEEGVIHVKCNAHPFMKANILMFNHPYFTTTDENGRFEILNIPPGHYKVKIWHENLSGQERDLTILSHQKTTLNVSLKK